MTETHASASAGDACDACRTYEQDTCCPMTDLEVDRTGCLGEVACNRRAEGGRVADADCDEETYPGGWCGECWSPTECDAVSRPRMCLMVIEDEEAEEDVDIRHEVAWTYDMDNDDIEIGTAGSSVRISWVGNHDLW